MSFSLRHYQEIGVRKLGRLRGRALLADEMGLGKTIQALAHCANNPTYRPIVVVCPAIVKYKWAAEAREFFGIRAEVLETRTPPKITRLRTQSHQMLIINYDILQYWVEWLLSIDPQIVIFDEMHMLGSLHSKRTKAARKLCRIVFHVIGLSGTPFSKVAQLFPFLNICRPRDFPSWSKFAWKYTQPRKRFGRWEFSGARNLQHLRERLQPFMIRRLIKDVEDELPSKTRIVIPVDISNRKDYEKLRNDFRGWLRSNSGGGRKPRYLGTMAEVLVHSGYLKRVCAQGKIKATIEWIRHFLLDTDKKLIVFAHHKFFIRALKEAFPHSVTIDGSVTGRKRQAAIEIFTEKKNCRLLFGNDIAAGAGWNGIAASDVLFAELPWVPLIVDQCIGRVRRIGQTKKCFAHFLVAHDTIEERVCLVLERRQDVFTQVIDGGDGEDLNIYTDLMQYILTGGK